jgi:hypothetical protein
MERRQAGAERALCSSSAFFQPRTTKGSPSALGVVPLCDTCSIAVCRACLPRPRVLALNELHRDRQRSPARASLERMVRSEAEALQ